MEHYVNKNTLIAAGGAAAALVTVGVGAYVAATRGAPTGPIKELYDFVSEENDHGGIIVGKVLKNHGVKCVGGQHLLLFYLFFCCY
jgi:hypothetical protein